WCRSLSDNTSSVDYELKGQIFNITPFITNLSTSHTKNGGNFSFSLVPVLAERDTETGKWALKKDTSIINEETGEVIVQSNLHDIRNNTLVRSQLLFHNMIGANDVVFIRYETLELEREQRMQDNSSFLIDKRNLGGRIYDLIGLVDRNTSSTNFGSYTNEITITGRDLSKLFIEDGTYFYAMENKQGVFHLQGGATKKNELSRRIIGTNAHLYLGLYFNNSIEEIIKFVIQQLSTIKVVPDDLFESYRNNNSFIEN